MMMLLIEVALSLTSSPSLTSNPSLTSKPSAMGELSTMIVLPNNILDVPNEFPRAIEIANNGRVFCRQI